MSKENYDMKTKTLGETDNFLVWSAVEPDGETTYHLEIGQVTLHFFEEEWEEFVTLMQGLRD